MNAPTRTLGQESGAPFVLAFGELLWDILPTGPVLGGAPANFCFRLHNLGVPSYLVSRVGADDNGTKAKEQLTRAGVDLRFLQTDASLPTGTVQVTLSAAGNASYFIVPGVAYDAIEATSELRAAAAKAAAICFGTLVQRSETTRRTVYEILDAAPQAIKVLDVNLRKDCFSPATVEASLQRATILKLNHEEVAVVGEMLSLPHADHRAFCAAVSERFGTKICIVTNAEKGAYARASSGNEVSSPGYKVRVVDTVGSGDSFTAAFLSAFLKGQSLEECCEIGNRYGAAAATKAGGMATISPAEVDSLCPARLKSESAHQVVGY